MIVVGLEAGAVVRSEDGGQSWSGHCRGAMRDCHSLTYHISDERWVYEGGGTGGAAWSRDGGKHWTQPRRGLDRQYGWAVAADPHNPEVWYVSVSVCPWQAHSAGSAEACIFRWSGDAWLKLGGGLPQPLNDMPYSLLADPAAPGHVYAGLGNGDVWHTVECGDTWQRLPFNLWGRTTQPGHAFGLKGMQRTQGTRSKLLILRLSSRIGMFTARRPACRASLHGAVRRSKTNTFLA